MKRLNLLVILTSAILALAAPVSAHSRPPLWSHGFEEVRSVSPSTIVVKHQTGLEQKLATSNLNVQAAMYPASPSILRPGERVNVFQDGTAKPLVVVHPAAYGTLKSTGATWSLISKHHGTLGLSGGNPQLLGMKDYTQGAKVMVFGAFLGQQKLDTAAVAARPILAPATVRSASNDTLTLKSEQYGMLTYALNQVPSAFRHKLASMTPGQTVVAGLNPLNRQVLMVWPNRVEKWAHTLERGTSGKVVAVSPKDLTLTNRLGTVTIPLDHKATLKWPGHNNAKVSQMTPGTRVIVLRNNDGSLNIMVLEK